MLPTIFILLWKKLTFIKVNYSKMIHLVFAEFQIGVWFGLSVANTSVVVVDLEECHWCSSPSSPRVQS